MYMYSKRNVKLGWFKMRQQNFVVCEPKFTEFFCVRRGIDRSCESRFPFIDISICSRDICDQILKLSENARYVDLG